MTRHAKAARLFPLLLLVGCGSSSSSAPPDAGASADARAPDARAPDALAADVGGETKIVEGQGPCAQGINLSIEGKQFFVPLALLPRATVVVNGKQEEAIPLAELLPAAVLDPLSFDGKFTTAELRLLYDCRLAGEQAGSAEVVLAPEAMATGYLLVSGRSVQLKDPGAATVQDVCRVEALRRMLVTRGGETRTVHVGDLPTEPYVEQGTQTTAVTFDSIVGASGLLAGGETLSQFDYRLVAVDFLGAKATAVRFPWGHNHLSKLRWVPSLAKTRSIDTVGNLLKPSSTQTYDGLASQGWSSIKLLVEVIMEPAPDPAHTVTGPDGPYTDPASCQSCHATIPVSCTQCHPR